MTEIARPISLLRKATLDGVENVWLLAVGYSLLHCALVADLAGRNAEAVVALVRAQLGEAGDTPASTSQIATERADVLSAEECLALDERRTECRSLGTAMNSLTMPLRRELILASSVVC